jgi:hypothetical protein
MDTWWRFNIYLINVKNVSKNNKKKKNKLGAQLKKKIKQTMRLIILY